MYIYSKKITKFVKDLNSAVKEILSREAQLKVEGKRFYDRRGWNSYPISVVIYNHRSCMGYFDSDFYELGFHECLMNVSKEQLYNVIRHELAHYLTFLDHGPHHHGKEFQECCQKLGWGEEVWHASFTLDEKSHSTVIDEEDPIVRRVKKLMALSDSGNSHEAEMALIKSQQLLLKHNLDAKDIDNPDSDDEKFFLKRIMKQKRENAKMSAVAQILKTFFVHVVFSRGGNYTYLEILGSAANLEVAEYVAKVLENELDKLWQQNKRLHPYLKGLVAQNSFHYGIAKGYCQKIEALQKAYPGPTANALMVLEQKLTDAAAMAYNRLSSSKSRKKFCSYSSLLGEQAGKELNIKPALKQNNQSAGQKLALVSL